MKAGGESKNVTALRPSPPSPGRKNRKKYTNHARSMGVYVASPSREEWRFDAVEDGDHLSKKAHLWKTASAGKVMSKKLLSIDQWVFELKHGVEKNMYYFLKHSKNAMTNYHL